VEHDTGSFKLGDWSVEPELDHIRRESEVVKLRRQVMQLLVYLAERRGRVVSTDDMLEDLWPRKVVASGSVYNCIAELRHALGGGDDDPPYIETIPRRGYRLVAPVTDLRRSKKVLARRNPRAALPLRMSAVPFLLGIALVAGYLVVSRTVLDEPPTASMPAATDLSIAVLPFEDLSPERNQAYLSDGIAEELLNALAQIDELRVISRASSFALRRADGMSTPELARRLDVAYLLQGAVRKAGDRVRVTAQLIDVRSDTHLWSQAYDRTLEDVFAIQDEISAQVVEALKIELLVPPAGTGVTDPEALELVLKGRYEITKRTSRSLRRAEELFEQAIAIDPDYAPAHAGLAKSLVLRADPGNVGATSRRLRAEAILNRALALDPANSDALATKGLMLSLSDPEAARTLYEQAITHNSSNSDAYRWLALNYGQSDPARYLELMHRAYLVDPLVSGLNFHWAAALFHFGRHEEALVAARDWYELNPGFPGSYVLAGRVHLSAGRFDEAIKSYYRAYRMQPDWDVARTEVAWLMAALNDLELAELWSREWQSHDARSDTDRAEALVLQIMLCDLRGKREQAQRLLAETEERHPAWWASTGRAYVLLRDFDRARQAWERGLTEPELEITTRWEVVKIADYALSLQHTGALERAEQLVSTALATTDRQLAAGMVHYALWTGVRKNLRMQAAALHAMRGELRPSLAALRQDALHGGVWCPACLRRDPQFDRLNDAPGFAAILAEQEARNDAQWRRLADQGLLLTPQEVLQLDDFPFDPFVD
jgi:TolB-like protein/DNA-binding winged helix-turn-helix (wHTH) protein/Tfp pilus assembly protein PilF